MSPTTKRAEYILMIGKIKAEMIAPQIIPIKPNNPSILPAPTAALIKSECCCKDPYLSSPLNNY